MTIKTVRSVSKGQVLRGLGAVLLTVSLLTTTAGARERITSSIDVQPKVKLTASESQAVSLAAGRIIRHVEGARSELTNNQQERAVRNIEKARTLVRIIENTLPPFKVRVEIKSGDLVYRHEEEVRPEFVRIFPELHRVDVVGRVVEAKQGVAKTGAPKSSMEEKDVASLTAAVRIPALDFAAIKLDVPLAKSQLDLAKGALKEGKPKEADVALAAVQTRGVVFEFAEEYLPLKEAAENLALAEFELDQEHPEDAQVALKTASDALRDYEETAGEHRAKEVHALAQEIDELNKQLEAKKEIERGATRVSAWWDRVVMWIRR